MLAVRLWVDQAISERPIPVVGIVADPINAKIARIMISVTTQCRSCPAIREEAEQELQEATVRPWGRALLVLVRVIDRKAGRGDSTKKGLGTRGTPATEIGMRDTRAGTMGMDVVAIGIVMIGHGGIRRVEVAVPDASETSAIENATVTDADGMTVIEIGNEDDSALRISLLACTVQSVTPSPTLDHEDRFLA